jgi:hypothetical protein
MGTKKGEMRKSSRRAYEKMPDSKRKRLNESKWQGSKTLFDSPKLMGRALKDVTGAFALRLAKIDELLGYRKRVR